MPNLTLTGQAQAILKNLNAVAKSNDPQLKVTPVGFLRMLLENGAGAEISNVEELRKGQNSTIKVRYMQRSIESEASSTDDCETTISPSWNETTIGHSLFHKIGIFINDDDMRLLTSDAATIGANGMPKVMLETIFVKINGLLQAIDSALVSAQSSAFGKNAAYPSDAAGANHNLAFGEKMDISDGLVKLRHDMSANEVSGPLLVCGNGRIVSYDVFNRYKTGADAQGIGSLPMNVYEDFKTATSWGANKFGVFEKGSVGFVDWLKNVGSYAGERGNSVFFTLPMPIQLSDGSIVTITFDAQLKYVDCPTYSGSTKTADRGWHLIISKSYGLFTLPNNCYNASDRLAGVRGSFIYTATEPTAETVNVATAAGTSISATVTPATGANFGATVTPAEGAVFHTQEETAAETTGD